MIEGKEWNLSRNSALEIVASPLQDVLAGTSGTYSEFVTERANANA
jgi:hypothetical protein